MRDHFNGCGEPGYAFAYQFPGMNRVLQAAGRVIRDEGDRGVVLLIDDRFNQLSYRELFPPEWRPLPVADEHELADLLAAFWSA